MEWAVGVSIISAVIAFLSLLYTVGKDRSSPISELQRQMSTVLERVAPVNTSIANLQLADSRLTERVVVVETKVETFWSQVSLNMATILHRPHPGYEARDALIEKLQAGSMTEDEANELAEMLYKVISDPNEERAERAVSALLVSALGQLYDLGNPHGG